MPVYPCCDNPDCPSCHGSGLAEVSPAQSFAMVVLSHVSVSDLNQDECRRDIVALCRLVLGHPPIYPESYTEDTLCPECANRWSICDCGLGAAGK